MRRRIHRGIDQDRGQDRKDPKKVKKILTELGVLPIWREHKCDAYGVTGPPLKRILANQ